jgi:hypothetical protein
MAMPFIFGNHQCPFSTLRVVSKHVDQIKKSKGAIYLIATAR